MVESGGFTIRCGQKRDFRQAQVEATELFQKTIPVVVLDMNAARQGGFLPIPPVPIVETTAKGANVDIDLHIEPMAIRAPSTRLSLSIGVRLRRPMWVIGDEIRIVVSVSRECHVSLINVGPKGNCSILVPNEFCRDTWLQAGQWHAFPDWVHNFAFPLLGPPGLEKVVALASDEPLEIEPHDFALTNHIARPVGSKSAINIVARSMRERVAGEAAIEFCVSQNDPSLI